jgi:peptide chain release factor 1
MMAWPKSVDRSQLRIDHYRGSGKGGQHRNKTDSACRIVHIPTGLMAQCEDERSQLQNRRQAFLRLTTKLIPLMKQAATVDVEVNAERVRTYNFKRNTVKDDRVPNKVYSLDKILDGDINDMLADIADSFSNKEV